MVAGYSQVGTAKSARRIPIDLSVSDFEGKPDIPTGVYTQSDEKRTRPYIAQGCYQGKKYNLGSFSDPNEAGEVYRKFKKNPLAYLKERGKI